MPRIPQVISDVSPRTAPRSLGVAEAPGQAIARLGQDVAGVGSEIFTQEQQLWQGRQVMEKTAEAAIQSKALYDQILNDPNIKDPDLAKTMQEGFKILHDRIGKDIKDPAVRFQYDQHFTALTTQFAVNAVDQQRKRLIDHGRASSDYALDVLSKEAPTATGQRLDAITSIAEGIFAHDVAMKLRNEQEATAGMIAFREQAYNAKYINQIRVNPAQAEEDLTNDTFLNPITKENLINNAHNAVLSQAAETLRQKLAEQAAAEKQFKEDRAGAVTNYISRAGRDDLSLNELEQQRIIWQLSREDYSAIRDTIFKGPDLPSIPKTDFDVDIAVHSTPPTITQQTLNAMRSSHQLDQPSFDRYSDKLKANRDAANDMSKSDLRARHTQAEQIIKSDFGLNGLLADIGNLNDVKQPLAKALEELTARSSAYGGSEDPLKILPSIRKSYLPLAASALQGRINVDVGLLPKGIVVKNDKNQLDVKATWNALGSFEDAQKKGMTREQYNTTVESLTDIETFKDTITHMNQQVPGENLR